MTESVGNETVEKYWYFFVSQLALIGCFNLTRHKKKLGYVGYVYARVYAITKINL
jgi:hypothetical protein